MNRIIVYAVIFMSLFSLNRVFAGVDEAWNFFKEKNFPKAAQEFNKVLQKEPTFVEALDGLGWSYYWMGKYEEAEKHFAKALEHDASYVSAQKGLSAVRQWRYALFNAAWGYFYAGDYSNAYATFEAILNDTTGRLPSEEIWQVHSGLGWCHFSFLNYEAALKEFETIAAMFPQNPYALKGIGFSTFRLGQHEQSIEALEKLIEIEPTWSDAIAMLGWNHYAQEDWNKAAELFRKAIQVNPFLADQHYGLAWTHLRRKDPESAQAAFKKAINLSPYHPSYAELQKEIDEREDWWSLYEEYAWAYYRAKAYTDAELLLNHALSKRNDDPALLRALGYNLFRQGRYQEAADVLERVVASKASFDPVEDKMYHAGSQSYLTILSNAESILAWSRYHLGELDQARAGFQRVIKDHGDWTDASSGLGWVYLAQGDHEQAEQAFAKALEQTPEYADALTGMSQVETLKFKGYYEAWNLFYQGLYAEAEAKFGEVIAQEMQKLRKEQQWQVYSGLGWSLYYQGKHGHAREQFSRVLTKSPQNVYALRGLAMSHYALEDWDEALKHLEAAIKIDPNSIDLRNLRAWTYYNQKRYGKAEEAFRQVLASFGEQASAYSGIGWTHLKRNNAAKAGEAFERALQLYPGYAEAQAGLDELQGRS